MQTTRTTQKQRQPAGPFRNPMHSSGTSRPARPAFTMLELLIVIVIIGILMSLLIPAIRGTFSRRDTVRVVAEITQLEQALLGFRQRFGEYPPSSLVIPAVGGSWSPEDRAKVRAIWPEFDFTTNGGLGNTEALKLSGAECLVFFLGGIESGTAGSSAALSGFSKNPQTPWTPSANPDGPFMEFSLGRLSDVDSDQLFEYLGPLEGVDTPYLFICAAGKKMNRDNDNYIRSLGGATFTTIDDDYDVFDPLGPDASRNMQMCYLKSDGTDSGSGLSDNQPYRADSFQLIYPGADGEYGTGGVWQSGTPLPDARRNEADNITNFSGSATLN